MKPLFTLLLALAAFAQSASIEGLWMGTLEPGPLKLRLALHVAKSSSGGLTATMDSIDQGANSLKVDSVTQTGQSLHFDLKMIAGSFDGTVNGEASQIDGQWHQAGASWPLILKRIDKLPDLTRPQDPKKPYPYEEREVTYENAKDGVKFAGTLTFPSSQGPFPGVLLITGSGPQDRNEALMGHRPFLVLSDYLTRHGIAVLRVDDRGVAGTTAGSVKDPTTENFAGDVTAGVEFLKTRKEVDPARIGLIGHSEGGMIAPMVAAQSGDVAFIVMMAGPGYRGDKLLTEQAGLVAQSMGATSEKVANIRSRETNILNILTTESDSEAAAKMIRAIWAAIPEAEKKAAGGEAALDAQLHVMNTNWFRFFLKFDPAPVLRKVRCPVLALNGANDVQVPTNNLPAIAAALEDGGNKDYEIVKLPGLNHLFQTSKTGSPAEYATISETIAPAALETIGRWIERHTAK